LNELNRCIHIGIFIRIRYNDKIHDWDITKVEEENREELKKLTSKIEANLQ